MVLLRILRLRVVLFALVAVALLWWGRGFGLREAGAPDAQEAARANADAAPGTASAPQQGAAAATAPGPEAGMAPAGAAAVPPQSGASGAGASVPAEAVSPGEAAAEVEPREADGEAEADRRGAQEEQMHLALRAGRFGEAFAVLAAVGGDAARTEAAHRALASAVLDLERAVRAGAFHAVMGWLARAEARTSAPVRAALDGLCASAGWPRLLDPGEGRRAGASVEPVPAPRLTGRLVRLSVEVRSPARVLEVHGDKAMLRVLSSDGVTFPERPVHELEPDAVTAEEAAELGLAAIAAGEGAAARVWAAIACARSAVRSSRLTQLLDLLPNP